MSVQGDKFPQPQNWGKRLAKALVVTAQIATVVSAIVALITLWILL